MATDQTDQFRLYPHTWTLPLSPGRWAYLQLPSRCVDEEEWEQMHILLQLFKRGLVTERPKADEEAEPVIDSMTV